MLPLCPPLSIQQTLTHKEIHTPAAWLADLICRVIELRDDFQLCILLHWVGCTDSNIAGFMAVERTDVYSWLIANSLMFDSAVLRQRQVSGNIRPLMFPSSSNAVLCLSLLILNEVQLKNPNEVACVLSANRFIFIQSVLCTWDTKKR